jgi:hypothetical protein
MMKAVRTYNTSVNINVTTWHYIPEDSKLHTRRREKVKSHGRFHPRFSLNIIHHSLHNLFDAFLLKQQHHLLSIYIRL